MSVWPSTSTPCWAHTLRVVIAWTASTSPACTEVMAWGARMEWKIWRARRGGRPDIAAALAAKVARSRSVHSHSRRLEEAELFGKGVVVERRLDLEDLDPAAAMSRPMRQLEECSSERRLVHERSAVAHGLRVVVVAQAAVAGETGGHALVPAVHGHEVDVDVDQEVARRRTLVDLHLLALLGLPRGRRGCRGPRRRAG